MPTSASSAPLRLILLLAFSAGIGGCAATTVVPPQNPPDPVPVMVADYGRHTSLLLPNNHGTMIEFAFGDWDFFALERTHWYDAVHAILFSSASTLGRREIAVTPYQKKLAHAINCKRVLEFSVSRESSDDLLRKLDDRFNRHNDTIVYNASNAMVHVKDDEPYGLCHECNQETAGWLKDLGCEIRGPAVTSNFQLAAVQQSK